MSTKQAGMKRQADVGERSQSSVTGGSWSAQDQSTLGGKADAMPVQEFMRAQSRLLSRLGIQAESRFVDVPAIAGRAHVLVSGEGPPVMMVIGGGIPAAMWAPLMAQLEGFTLYAVDLPGFGLTDPVRYTTEGLRTLAVSFLEQVLDGLDLNQPVFVSNSMGALWTTWLALDRPQRVAAMVQVGCPALMLGTSAPVPMRLLSVPTIGRLLLRLQPPSPQQADREAVMVREDFSHLPELRAVLVAFEKLPTYAPAWLGLLHSAIRLRGARPKVTLTAEQLAQLRQPVQIIWGERDPFGSPAVGRRAAAIIPNADLHIVPGGHAPWFRGAEQIARTATPFLRKHSPAAHL